jgi:hypothetical protein
MDFCGSFSFAPSVIWQNKKYDEIKEPSKLSKKESLLVIILFLGMIVFIFVKVIKSIRSK